jgi:alkanesulfonate monooxygenase SsuD/methylene tetrahydromethanopterin reductase-like flavin-dependent oxidoreductase (luciferase family)
MWHKYDKCFRYAPNGANIPPIYSVPVKLWEMRAIKTAAKYCDGLITVTKANQSREILDLFNKSAKDADKDPSSLEKIAKRKICYSSDYDKPSSI